MIASARTAIQRAMPDGADPSVSRPAIEAATAILATEGARVAAPWPLKLVVATMFLPEGLSFFLFDLRLTATRVILLLFTPVLVMRAGRHLTSGGYRFVISDLLVPAAGVWMFLAPTQIVGADLALRHSGPIALEFCIAYLATRTLLVEQGQALSLATMLCGVIAIIALLGLLDPLTGTYAVRKLVGSLTGHWRMCDGPGCFRYGLLRATGALEQTILYALACGIGLLLALGAEIRWRRSTILACTLGLIFSFSAGPALGVVFGFGLLFYDRVVAGFDRRWSALALLAVVGLGLLFALELFAGRLHHPPFHLRPGFGLLPTVRLACCRHRESCNRRGSGSVSQTGTRWPGRTDCRPLSTRCGWSRRSPSASRALRLSGSAMLGSVSFPTTGASPTLTAAEARLATTLGILILVVIFVGFTVHLWGSDWILCGLLAGISAHLTEQGRDEVAARYRVAGAETTLSPQSRSREGAECAASGAHDCTQRS